jgi:hypothetical protein
MKLKEIKLKLVPVLLALVLFFLAFPEKVWAEYYTRKGEIANPKRQETVVVPTKKAIALPNNVGWSVRDRKFPTASYYYIVENSCEALSVNLYTGETFYSCPSGVEFWSPVSTSPFFLVKNRKKVDDEDDEFMSAAMASAAATNMVVMSP